MVDLRNLKQVASKHTIRINNVLLVKIDGSVWYTIYHHLLAVIRGQQTPLLINQPMRKGHLRSEYMTLQNEKRTFDLFHHPWPRSEQSMSIQFRPETTKPSKRTSKHYVLFILLVLFRQSGQTWKFAFFNVPDLGEIDSSFCSFVFLSCNAVFTIRSNNVKCENGLLHDQVSKQQLVKIIATRGPKTGNQRMNKNELSKWKDSVTWNTGLQLFRPSPLEQLAREVSDMNPGWRNC